MECGGEDLFIFLFFFNDTATTEIYTFPYTTLFRSDERRVRADSARAGAPSGAPPRVRSRDAQRPAARGQPALLSDRKSTRLNSSHANISYGVFCLKKKNSRLGSSSPAPVRLPPR